MNQQDMLEWLERRGELSAIKTAACDLNGVFRGKRLPVAHAKKALKGEVKMPLTAMFLDIWGKDVIKSGQVFETGDVDGVVKPTERGFLPVDWLDSKTALLPTCMHTQDGEPYGADPRHALARVVKRYHAKGLTPVCAPELEFYIYDRRRGALKPPKTPDARRRLSANSVYSLQDVDCFDAFLNDIYAACEAMGVPAESAISENGCGQFEINFIHGSDALRAADDAQIFKYLAKGVAKKHGFGATFMAKPYGRQSGSGFHTHFSVLDEKGANIFANGAQEGSQALRWAVGGLLEAMPACMLVFAPHANSYRRLRDGAHAPVNVAWGYDNRTCALRIPSGADAARRIEHRVSGADANPYLVLTAVLGAALLGMENKTAPNAPVSGNAYASDRLRLPATWHAAIENFAAAPVARDLFGDFLVDMYVACKRQEYDAVAQNVSPFEHETYLETV